MSGNLTLALLSAQSGMAANQVALDAATSNITNSNSPTYSRKVAVFEQRTVNGNGAGVRIADIVRNVDEGLLRTLRTQYSGLKEVEIQQSYFQRMQSLFGTPADNSSISHIITKLTSSMESLALSPEKPLEQSELSRWGQEVTYKLHQINTTIQDLRLEADVAIGGEVTKINELVRRIQSQNEEIVKNESYDRDTTGLKDQRDADLNALSEIIDIQYFTRKTGEIVVYSKAGNLLVDSVPITITHTSANKVDALYSYDSGDFDGIWIGSKSNSTNDITNKLGSGTLKGLVDIRDSVLDGLQVQIDELASQMREIMNQEHNRGVSFPGMQALSGTRKFADASLQTITLDAASKVDDVSIVLFDSVGAQQATTTLETIMTSATYGSGAQAANGPWTVKEVADSVQDWLRSNGAVNAVAAINSDGKFNIELNEPTLNIGFRDQVSSTAGSAGADASIGFDSDGDGNIDETISGFSYFFGMNDFFESGLKQNIFDSNALAASYSSSAATLNFRDTTGNMVASPATSVSIPAGSSLDDIAELINSNVNGITASVLSDGPYFRLRIINNNPLTTVITHNVAGGDTLLNDIGLKQSSVQSAGLINVRADIVSVPANIARGKVQWDSTIGVSGQYYTSAGDGSNMIDTAKRFTQIVDFSAGGGIAASSITFESYSTTILSTNASFANTNELRIEYQSGLTNSIQDKSDSIRGVNIDEEMSQLLLFEQAYVAATRVIAVIQKMLDALENVV